EQQHTYPECLVTKKGRDYVGTVKNTESGEKCLPWNDLPYGIPDDFSPTETYQSHFPNRDAWSHNNFCRNPSGRERPWCFVSDAFLRWEYCDIPMCTRTEPQECKVTQQGGEYTGKKNVTHSGFPCLPWGNLQPIRDLKDPSVRFPDFDSLDEGFNFCRNPNGDAAPWCFYMEGVSLAWEYCDVRFCEGQGRSGKREGEKAVYPECRLSEKGKEYVGTKNETETGEPCLHWATEPYGTPWDFFSCIRNADCRRRGRNTWGRRTRPRRESRRKASEPYGTPWDFFNRGVEYALHFLNLDPTVNKSYCRNPGLYRERPWCFVSDPNIQWKYCDIPLCQDPNPPECKLTRQGGEYVGKRNATLSGFPCQHWLASTPNKHLAIKKQLSAFPDEVDGSHNFCRNPDGIFH
ncbi:unnamed protein product, partial [Darwinula stevensoni]